MFRALERIHCIQQTEIVVYSQLCSQCVYICLFITNQKKNIKKILKKKELWAIKKSEKSTIISKETSENNGQQGVVLMTYFFA